MEVPGLQRVCSFWSPGAAQCLLSKTLAGVCVPLAGKQLAQFTPLYPPEMYTMSFFLLCWKWAGGSFLAQPSRPRTFYWHWAAAAPSPHGLSWPRPWAPACALPAGCWNQIHSSSPNFATHRPVSWAVAAAVCSFSVHRLFMCAAMKDFISNGQLCGCLQTAIHFSAVWISWLFFCLVSVCLFLKCAQSWNVFPVCA